MIHRSGTHLTDLRPLLISLSALVWSNYSQVQLKLIQSPRTMQSTCSLEDQTSCRFNFTFTGKGTLAGPHTDTGAYSQIGYNTQMYTQFQSNVFPYVCVCARVSLELIGPYHTHHLLSQSQSSTDTVSISNWAPGDAKACLTHALTHAHTHTHWKWACFLLSTFQKDIKIGIPQRFYYHTTSTQFVTSDKSVFPLYRVLRLLSKQK